jgi:hypothetical protein
LGTTRVHWRGFRSIVVVGARRKARLESELGRLERLHLATLLAALLAALAASTSTSTTATASTRVTANRDDRNHSPCKSYIQHGEQRRFELTLVSVLSLSSRSTCRRRPRPTSAIDDDKIRPQTIRTKKKKKKKKRNSNWKTRQGFNGRKSNLTSWLRVAFSFENKIQIQMSRLLKGAIERRQYRDAAERTRAPPCRSAP